MEEKMEKIKNIISQNDKNYKDRYFLILIISSLILIPSSIMGTYWAFKEQPLPQYALELMKVIIDNFKFVICSLIGFQSLDSFSLYKLKKKETEIIEKERPEQTMEQ